MASFAPDIIERTITIDWNEWTMKFEEINNADATASQSRVIDIPGDW